MSKRYFINNLDSPLGQEFYSQLVKEDTEEGIHMATYKVDDPNKMPPKGFKKILKRYKPKLSRKKMLEECDVYIYDVASATQQDLDYVCDIFKSSKTTLEEQKILILVSSVLSWSAMPDKVKPKVEKKPEEDQEGQPEQQEQPPKQEDQDENQEQNNDDENQNQDQEQQQQKQEQQIEIPEVIEYVPWEESDYKLRNASAQYQQLKDWEEMVLSLQKENLKVFVVCAGLIYGKGEQLFQKYFKKAWLQQPYKLSYQADGNNKVPTVHIADLVKMIIKVSETAPESNYIFAVDNTQDRTQKAIIQGIATGVGSGWIEQNDDFFKDFTPEEMDCFRLHLDCKTSQLFIGNEEQPSDFEWHCEKGIAFNAKKILQEFTTIHKLRPIKILIECKAENMRFNDILNMISEHYRIPVITQQQIFKDAQDPNYVFPQEIQEDFNEYLTTIQEYIDSQQPPTQMTEELKIYYKVIKWRLSQNDCQNRGYILSNFPNFAEESEFIFFPNKQKLKLKKKPKKKVIQEVQQQTPQQPAEPAVDENGDPIEQEPQEEQPPAEEQPPEEQQEEEPQEEEQQEEEQEGGPKSEDFFPESYIIVKPLGKIDQFDYNRKLKNYFGERGLDAQFIDPRKKTNHDTFENLRIYIERNGRPYNYLQNEAELITMYFNLQKIKDLTIKYTRKQAIQIWKSLVKVNQDKRKGLVEKYTKYIKEQEQELQQVKQFPFRNYLMDFVVPVLNEGLVEVAHILPDDPVEFLMVRPNIYIRGVFMLTMNEKKSYQLLYFKYLMNQQKVNIWLDCDVGNDDAMAIILALFDPKSNLLGISACFGNTSIENSTSNTLRVISTVGKTEIPVFKGSESSLKSVRIHTDAHGKQGLFGYEKLITNCEPVKDTTLYDLMKKQAKEEKFTVVITGPQTNIAKLLVEHPDIMEQIQQIVFMGGVAGFGNVTPNAEYNIYADPEAAQQVIDICKENQIKLVMISLDLTHTCLVEESIQNRIKSINSKFTDWCHEMLLEFLEAYRVEEFDYPPLHDPLALFYALHPECYITKKVYVGIECESKQCYGRTIVDKLGFLGQEPTVEFCRKVDLEVFWNHMIDAIKCAAKHSLIE